MDFDSLYEAAKAALLPRVLTDHAECGMVAAALLADSGKVYTGVNIDTHCGLGFCAEHSAASAMLAAGDNRVLKMVAVNKSGEIMPPCGRCRELISQLHDENFRCEVLVAKGRVARLADLLPMDWKDGWKA